MPSPLAPSSTPFLGLAPFLRRSIAGDDLGPLTREMLGQVEAAPEDAHLWMNLAIAMQCFGQRELGVAMLHQALALQRLYHLPAAVQPATFRLLMLMVPGDVAANTPLECLLENSDVDLDFYYVTPGDDPLALPLPEHDALLVAISEADDTLALLATLEARLADWPKPVINLPGRIPAVGRERASQLLQGIPGLCMPPTLRARRFGLQSVASGMTRLAQRFPGCDFPIILRPVGSHAGRDLERLEGPVALAAYLDRVGDAEFFLSPFIDYRSPDGLYRKMRIALVDGVPYPCHMGVSSHWMIHYVNAGMYEDAAKREDEARFMADFAAFAQRHEAALAGLYQRVGLDYFCLDGAETVAGELLVFEIDHAMVVHAMDPEAMFPYKQGPMGAVKQAFRDLLCRRIGGTATPVAV